MPAKNKNNRIDQRHPEKALLLRRMSLGLVVSCLLGLPLSLSGCAGSGPEMPPSPQQRGADHDPVDILPVARFTTPINVDDMARCIGEGWARLSVIGDGKVTLHPGLRGLIVDVKAVSDPLARSYVEVYPSRGITRVDYYIRSFVSDPIENLRFRAMQQCLGIYF